MTQTTAGFSSVNAKVEYSTDGGVTWHDISGFANTVKPGAGTRQTGLRFTHEGDTAIITAGKRASIDVDISVVFTEVAAPDPFEALRAEFEASGTVIVRWAPKGNTAGNFLFATDDAAIKKLDYPYTDTEDAKPIAVSFTIETAKITKTTV